MGKGPDHERELCSRFGLWWTSGERDDVFWRAQGSGGRGTRRARKGLATHGQHGDIAATHPIGEPFIDFITIELKRGYTKTPIIDLPDRPNRGACTGLQCWDKFLNQTLESHHHAGTFAWAIVSRRDHRVHWLYMPRYLCNALRAVGAMQPRPRPFMAFTTDVRTHGPTAGPWLEIVGVTLDYFFKTTYPIHVKKLIRQVEAGTLCPPGK